MKHGISETLLLVGGLLLVIGSLILLSNSYADDESASGITRDGTATATTFDLTP